MKVVGVILVSIGVVTPTYSLSGLAALILGLAFMMWADIKNQAHDK